VKEGAWQIDRANVDRVRVEVDGEHQFLEIQDLKHDRMALKRVT
jgi:hypothetical protein